MSVFYPLSQVRGPLAIRRLRAPILHTISLPALLAQLDASMPPTDSSILP
jgi:hypothetical protein